MEGVLKIVSLMAGLLVQMSGLAQGLLPPCAFAWDAPEKMDHATGYRLQWGPQDTADVPLHQTIYEVEYFPVGLLLPVSVSTTGITTNSPPITIYVYNVNADLEESEDLTNWTSIASVMLRGPRKPNSFLRLVIRRN